MAIRQSLALRDRDTNIGDGNYNERVERNVIHAQQVNVIENYVADKTNETSEKEIADRRLAFAIAGSIDQVDQAKLKVIAALLQEISGDASIKIINLEEGSIKLILEGSPEGLEKLKELFESGKLAEINGVPVEYVHFLEAEIANNETKIKASQKSRLIKEIKTKYVFGRNLSSVDLRSANLSDAYLRGANLSSADLRSANLSDTYLRGAYLRDANLRDADMRGAYIRGVNLKSVNLSGSDLSNAKLLEANLTDVDLSGTNVGNTRFGSNSGISRSLRRDLIARGAIFVDPPGDRSRILTPIS